MRKKVIVVLEGRGGVLDRQEVSYEERGDADEAVNLAVHEAISGMILSPGDTIKIREPGTEER
jgi:hypothetical protein